MPVVWKQALDGLVTLGIPGIVTEALIGGGVASAGRRTACSGSKRRSEQSADAHRASDSRPRPREPWIRWALRLAPRLGSSPRSSRHGGGCSTSGLRRLWRRQKPMRSGGARISRVVPGFHRGLSRIGGLAGFEDFIPRLPSGTRVPGWAAAAAWRHGGGQAPDPTHRDPKPGVRALRGPVLVDPVTRGDPMSPLRWTCKSVRPNPCGRTPGPGPHGERAVGQPAAPRLGLQSPVESQDDRGW